MIFKITKIIFALYFPLLLCSCASLTDYKESEQVIIVSAVGIEKTEQGYLFSAETVSKEDDEKSVIVTARANKIDQLLNSLRKATDSSLIFSHCSSLVLSKDLSKKDIEGILYHLSKISEFPLSCRVSATESPLELLKAKSLSGGQTGYALSRVLKNKKIDSQIFIMLRNNTVELPEFEVSNKNFILKDNLWTPKTIKTYLK